jgi:hypothetical protein
MTELTNETITGYNTFILRQKDGLENNTRVTLVLFDDRYEVVYDGRHLNDVKPLDGKTYYCRGLTALNDAIGKALNEASARHRKNGYPDNVVCLIMTDGEENSSQEFKGREGKKKIKRMVEYRQKKGWTFFFLGAEMDAFEVGFDYGFQAQNIAVTRGDRIGTQAAYAAVSSGAAAAASGQSMSMNLQETYDLFEDELEEDEEDEEDEKFIYRPASRLPK